MLNDAVAIVLARTVLTFNHPAAKEGGEAVALALLVFVAIFLGSTLIGGVAGAASALLFKAQRLSERPGTEVVEASLAFAFPWAAFYASEALGLSGIVAILFCGVVMATYARPNLRRAAWIGRRAQGAGLGPRGWDHSCGLPIPPPSPTCTSTLALALPLALTCSAAAILLTSGCFDALAKVSEAFVFIYLGMALLAFPIFSHHTLWLLTIVALVACLLGRLHVFPLLWLAARLQAQRCGGAEARRPASAQAPLGLRPKHAVCIWFSGLRGGVAFALAAASYEARDFPARCGGRPALAAAAADDAADDARGEGWLFSHCPRELNDSLAIVQATLLLAVFTIFVYGAAARDVALLSSALPQPGAGRDESSGVDSGRVDECAELTLDEPTGEASDAELEARRNAATSRLPASSRWNALNARLVLLLTRQRAPLHARAPRPLKTMDSDADL